MGWNISQSGVSFSPSVGVGIQFNSFIYEQKTGEVNTISKEEYIEALKRAELYSKDLSAVENNDDLLKYKIMTEFNNFKEGCEGVQTITTKTQDYGLDIYGRYINRKGEVIAGYFKKTIFGSKSISISVSTMNSDISKFRATVGHEIIHAVHHNRIRNYKSEYSESIAYKYSAQVYLKGNYFADALFSLITGNQYYNGAVPYEYLLYNNKYINY